MITIDSTPRILGLTVIACIGTDEAFLARFIPKLALPQLRQHFADKFSQGDGAAGFNHASPSIAGAKRNHG